MGHGQCNAKKTTSWLISLYQSFLEQDIYYTDLDKLRHLRNHMHVQGNMAKEWWLNSWKDKVNDAIAGHLRNGTPVVFTDWTTSLINGEEECIRDLKKNNHTISSAYCGSGDGNGGNSGASGASKLQGTPCLNGKVTVNLLDLGFTRYILQSVMVIR